MGTTGAGLRENQNLQTNPKVVKARLPNNKQVACAEQNEYSRRRSLIIGEGMLKLDPLVEGGRIEIKEFTAGSFTQRGLWESNSIGVEKLNFVSIL
jgi:hypothetical protein